MKAVVGQTWHLADPNQLFQLDDTFLWRDNRLVKWMCITEFTK